MATTVVHRLAILFWAALMLALPAAEAIADARVAAAAGDVRVHVEDEQRRDCPRVHAHDCAICQHLTTAPLPQSRSSLRSEPAGADGPALEDPSLSPPGWRAIARPRAPPRHA